MLGFPTETEEEMEMTLEVACNSRLHSASFFTVVPFPGTELYATVEKTAPDKLKDIDYNYYNGGDYAGSRINLSAVPDEVLFGYQREAWRRFYLNPGRHCADCAGLSETLVSSVLSASVFDSCHQGTFW